MSQSKTVRESKRLLKLSAPIIVGQVGQNLIILADTLMIGALGALALAASAFAGSVFVVFLICGIGVLSPLAAMFAKMQGQGDYPRGGVLLKHSLAITLGLSALLMIALYLVLLNLDIFGQTPEIIAIGKSFFEITSWSLAPCLIFQCYKQFTDGIGKTKLAMYVMVGGVLLNIGGNYVLIFGKAGFPAMGLNGAAYATLASRTLMALVLFFYVHLNPHLRKYLAEKWTHHFDHFTLKNMIRLGIPNGLTYLFEVGAFSSAAVMMGWFGAMPLAAHQITISLASMTFLISVGVGIASSIRVGYELGREDFQEARFAGFTSMKLGAIYSALCAVGFLLLRHWLPTLYVKDTAVIELAALLFVVVAIFQIFDGLQAVSIGALRGLSDTAWPSAIAFISYWLLGLPGGYFLAFHLGMGPVGIWMGLLIGLACASIMLTIRFDLLSRRLLE